MVAHAAFEHLADVLVGAAFVPGVDYLRGYLGLVLEVAADEAGELGEVGDVGGLVGGDDVLILLVGHAHALEEDLFVVGEVDFGAFDVFGEACGLEGGLALVDALALGADGEHVALLHGEAEAVDEAVAVECDAVGAEVHEGRDAVAAAGGDDVDGGGHDGEDGVDLVEGDGVLGDEVLLAEAYVLAAALVFAGPADGEAEASGDGGAREDGEAVAEELERGEGAFVDGGGDDLAEVVGIDEVGDVGVGYEAFVAEVDGGDEGGAAGHLGSVELEDREEAELVGAGLDGELDGDGRLVAGFEFFEQGVEVVDGGELRTNLGAVAVGEVFGGDVAGHDFLAEDVAVALDLLAFAGAGVAAVEHAGVALVVAHGPHHALEDEAREGLLALHEGEDEVGVVGVEAAHVLCEAQGLVVRVGGEAGVAGGDAAFEVGDALLLVGGREGDVGGGEAVVEREHLAEGVECAEVDASGHGAVVHLAEGQVGGACDADVEQCGHEAGDILRHGAADGEDEGCAAVAEAAVGHDLEVADGLFEEGGEAVGLGEGAGGEDDEVGHGVAVAREVEEHAPFVRYFLVGEVAGGEGGDEAVAVGEGVVGHEAAALVVEAVADGGQLLPGVGGEGAVALGEEELEEVALVVVAALEEAVHVVPPRGEFAEGLGGVALEAVDDGAGLVAFELVGGVLAVVVENLAAAAGVEVDHVVVGVAGPDAEGADFHGW